MLSKGGTNMKRILLLGFVLLMISGAVCAQLPPIGTIGLFADEGRTTWCATGAGPPPPYYAVEMWIWCLPNNLGMMCAEFMLAYPDPSLVIKSTVTQNDSVCVALGTLDTGMSVCFCTCQWDWIWPFHQTLYVAPGTKMYIEIVVHPDPFIKDVQFANCEPGLPIEPVHIFSNLYLNYDASEPECGEPGTREATWGAIKSMYR